MSENSPERKLKETVEAVDNSEGSDMKEDKKESNIVFEPPQIEKSNVDM